MGFKISVEDSSGLSNKEFADTREFFVVVNGTESMEVLGVMTPTSLMKAAQIAITQALSVVDPSWEDVTVKQRRHVVLKAE